MSMHPVNQTLHDKRTFGQKTADEFTNAGRGPTSLFRQ